MADIVTAHRRRSHVTDEGKELVLWGKRGGGWEGEEKTQESCVTVLNSSNAKLEFQGIWAKGTSAPQIPPSQDQ